MEKTYAKLEAINPCLRREAPYCAFQHVYTGMLNAIIIDHVNVKVNNCEDRFVNEESPANLIPHDMTVPAPIAEYFKMVMNATTPQGDNVHINLPNGGMPHRPIPAGENLPRIPSGSFGRITERSHNAYEYYVSPYVTSRLVEETTRQNTTQVFESWNPLPDGAFPANCLPNRNLLGYRDVERLTPEGLQSLAIVDFPDDDTMAG